MFRTIGANAPIEAVLSRGTATPAAEVSELIGRYPNLSETDLARLINLYRELSSLDVALMISDEKLGPKLDHFSNEHRSQIRTPFRQYAALVGTGLVGLAVIAWSLAFL